MHPVWIFQTLEALTVGDSDVCHLARGIVTAAPLARQTA
jgi:hypothetical protein